jgi:membrane protein implicated in regulation of membrane protease activity
MDDWVWWMIATGLLAVGEILTPGAFFLGPVALATLLAALVALAGAALTAQWIVFIVAAIASLGILRPIARRHIKMPARLRTGTAALVGSQAVVLERVDLDSGMVKIGGEVWTARAYDEDDVLEPGARAHVMKIDGATALVSE